MSTIYYIDSENVGDSWVSLLDNSPENDSKYLVFYTDHSPRMAYSQVIQLSNATIQPEYILCHEGNNALDFQLVTYLGYQLHINSLNKMVIVSNDTGFDAAVRFWQERGMNVTRITSNNILTTETHETLLPVSDEVVIASSSSVEKDKKIFGIDITELYTIINCIGSENPSYIHLAFVHFYGNKNGENIYTHMKKDKFYAPPVQWKKDTRIKKLIELIIHYTNNNSIKIPDDFPSYLANNVVDDKKAMQKKINSAYSGNGPHLQKMFKPFYKTLVKIKK